MQPDRYSRIVLTVIAAALVYLCVVLTPWPALQAQQTALRPGDPTGPAEVVVIGWRPAERVDVHVSDPVSVAGQVRVTGLVQTQQSPDAFDRVVLAGWEERATLPPSSGRVYRRFDANAVIANPPGLPVVTLPTPKD